MCNIIIPRTTLPVFEMNNRFRHKNLCPIEISISGSVVIPTWAVIFLICPNLVTLFTFAVLFLAMPIYLYYACTNSFRAKCFAEKALVESDLNYKIIKKVFSSLILDGINRTFISHLPWFGIARYNERFWRNCF
jgi:hypothetical protein